MIPPEHMKVEIVGVTNFGVQHCGIIPMKVRVTHIATGLEAVCDVERSQMKNRNICISMIEWGLSEIGFRTEK